MFKSVVRFPRGVMRFAPGCFTGQLLVMGGAASVVLQYYDLCCNQRYVTSGVEGGVALAFLVGAYVGERCMEHRAQPVVAAPGALDDRLTPPGVAGT